MKIPKELEIAWDENTDTVYSYKPKEELSKAALKFITLYNLRYNHKHERECQNA